MYEKNVHVCVCILRETVNVTVAEQHHVITGESVLSPPYSSLNIWTVTNIGPFFHCRTSNCSMLISHLSKC